MRNANQNAQNSGIYARIREVQMSEADRHAAMDALNQAENIVSTILWVKEKLASLGHVFLKPQLRH